MPKDDTTSAVMLATFVDNGKVVLVTLPQQNLASALISSKFNEVSWLVSYKVIRCWIVKIT